MKRLLVIIPDRITEILEKGEFQPCYYNPGEVFDEVHILMTNDDKPPPQAVQPTVGRAKLVLHNYPDDLSLVGRHNALLTPLRLRRWAKGGVEIARRIAPDMIRCHGADWNAYLAARINAELGIPYVVSLHINPDENPVRRFKGPNLSSDQRRTNAFYEYLEKESLRRARLVLPVYKPILPYLARLGVTRVEVCYNILDGGNLRQKTNYALSDPPHLLYVGRLFDLKNPSNILRALVDLPGVHYTIVGDGPLRPEMETLARDLGIADRVSFRPAVANAELCRMLSNFDLFVIHTEHYEISKSLLEALLSGLPSVINIRKGAPVPELQSDIVRLVPNSVEGYRDAIRTLLSDDTARQALGRRAFEEAQARYGPSVTERKVTDIYRSILEERLDRQS